MRWHLARKDPKAISRWNRAGGGGKARGDRGVALVITLLLMFLMSVVGLAAVLTFSSDMLINGYYRNFRGSFYAADAGLAIARQALINQTAAAIPANFVSGTPPIPAGTEGTVRTYITNTYGDPTQSQDKINQGNAASSWPAKFKITNVSFGLLTSPAQPTVTAQGFQYIYTYSLTAMGMSQGSEQATISEEGSITINANVTPSGPTNSSFAAFGMFIDQYAICSGSYLVPGTITGPVFTNGSWTFGNTGSYTFTDQVGSHGANAGFQFGSCYQSPAGSYTSGGQSISPSYQSGHQWGQNSVPLPANSFSQKEAVVDGLGTSCASSGCPSNATMHAMLKNVSGSAYPTTGASSGVWLPYTSVNGTNTVTGGGILVEGNASVVLSTANVNGEPANTQQVFTIVNNSVTTTITVDPVANTTKVSSGATNLTLAGVPANCSNLSSAPTYCTTIPTVTSGSTPGAMLYVDGTISSLRGPSNGTSPAVANASAVTVTAANDVNITGNITYVAEPVTLTAQGSTPIDTLVPANDTRQVLGIFTATGNINLALSSSNQNLEIDASLATISAGGSGGLVNTGQAINTLSIVGGRIQNTIQNINTTTRNVLFDRRFASGGFAPPWFPSTTITPPNTSTATVNSQYSRVQWVSNSSM